MEITPKCEVGGGVFFPHPQGNVIGARRVGRSVTFVHGVMVGAINQDTAFTPEQRPIIGDNVVLNAGCRVLGGIEVGDGAVVGANSLVIRSVPPNTTVLGVPAEVIFRRGTEDSKIGKD
jgi:serine O-acetyltransferase